MPFKVTDDSGFLAIIDPDTYRGFVHADWTWETIQEHFTQEMGERHLLIWGTGLEHVWTVDVSLEGYGTDAVDAIESGVLASMCDESAGGSLPRDLDSVMVMYTKLVRKLQLEHRCAAFLRRLSPRFRTSGLRGIHIIWSNNHPRPGPLPEPLHGYVQELSESGTEPEQRVARMALRDCK
jgi:hypothetical protein